MFDYVLVKKHTLLVEYRLVIEGQDKGVYSCSYLEWDTKQFYLKLQAIDPALAKTFDRLIDDTKLNAYNEGYQEAEENNAW